MYTTEEKIAGILEWASGDCAESFNSSFVESLAEQLEECGNLSERQIIALDNIIEKFGIEVGDYI